MTTEQDDGAFEASRERFEQVCGFLAGVDAAHLTHGELETRLALDLGAVVRQLYQDHLDLRAAREQRIAPPADATGARHGAVEAGHVRPLETVFGEVAVSRLAYRHRGQANLYPSDAALNLPAERHSHGLRELAAVESSRGSFDEAQAAIERSTGVRVGKRQVEALTVCSAVDFEAFYEQVSHDAAEPTDLVVVSCDGKGIVMRPDALRAETARAAAASKGKLKTRLSKGEKRNRKRMAEVGTVYGVTPVVRSPSDIIGRDEETPASPAPKATNKWLTASVVDDAARVITQVFDEAERRDPAHQRTWIALVDGARHQIERIGAEAALRGVEIAIVCDFVHVLEYLWKAVWSFYPEADPDAETFVADKALAVLNGKASVVAASLRRKATHLGLDPRARENADRCADYLLAKRDYLDYPRALAAGWPIATGVIEGACRHLVKDRLDLTGSRWGLEGAEAILKLRALRSNGDWDDYWRFHLHQQHQRVHRARYLNAVLPTAA